MVGRWIISWGKLRALCGRLVHPLRSGAKRSSKRAHRPRSSRHGLMYTLSKEQKCSMLRVNGLSRPSRSQWQVTDRVPTRTISVHLPDGMTLPASSVLMKCPLNALSKKLCTALCTEIKKYWKIWRRFACAPQHVSSLHWALYQNMNSKICKASDARPEMQGLCRTYFLWHVLG